MSKIKIVIAEYYNKFGKSIKSLLGNEDDLDVIAEASNGLELFKIFNSGTVNADEVLLISVMNMPGLNGIDKTSSLVATYPNLKILILSTQSDQNYVIKAFNAGAIGYILKDVDSHELIFGIRHIMNNNARYLSAELSIDLLDRALSRSPVMTDRLAESELSKRELEILSLIAEGFTNQEIANKIFTSKRTVEGHRQNLIDKTHSRNSASLIRYAVLRGIVT